MPESVLCIEKEMDALIGLCMVGWTKLWGGSQYNWVTVLALLLMS